MWLVAAVTPAPHPLDKSRVEPGWIGFVFLIALALAVVLLWFSLRKHLGRIDVGRHDRERGAGRPADDTPPTKAT
jgi:hypothetical protein